MNPKHHPGATLILAYASGSLSEGLGLVVASHMSLCKQCQENVRDAERERQLEKVGVHLIRLQDSEVKKNMFSVSPRKTQHFLVKNIKTHADLSDGHLTIS